MKQLLTSFFVLVSTSMLLLVPGHVTALDVNNFKIATYDIAYTLDQTEQGVSTLDTTETITAVFPEYDQNHGIERAIPNSYNNHPISLSVTRVTNEQNQTLPYTTYESNGNTVVRIGDASTYVHGSQTYIINYQQQYVTEHFSDTADDEFYWDTNGTDWRVPIEALTVSLTIDKSLTSSLTGNTACYQGVPEGLNQAGTKCALTQTGNVYTVSANSMQPGENVTIAIGFKPGSFATYQQPLANKLAVIWVAILPLSFIASIVLVAWAAIRWYRRSDRKSEIGTIIPEYLPPKNISVTTAASIVRADSKAFAAQLIDFAVQHHIKIYQTKEKSFWRSAEYEIEIVRDPSTLLSEEQEILSDIYDHTPVVGERLALKKLKNNRTVFSNMSDNSSKLTDLLRDVYGLRARDAAQQKWFTRTSIITLVFAVLLLNPFLLITAVIVFFLGKTLYPLTDKGLALSRYLLGLRDYIKVAEADRLKMLQSPEGALKIGGANPNDPAQLVKLYERVLPYAILFGQEKDWNRQLGRYYESTQTSPDWYQGNSSAFTAAMFASTISSFTTSTTYSSPSSSSSGGSFGGGFSGGGGGGGGGGGW